MRQGWGRADLGAAALLVAAALGIVFGVLWRNALAAQSFPSLDIYAYSYPIFLRAQTALAQGHGLLWNDLQNCGQPFFGIVSTALLYPPNLLGLVVGAPAWLWGQAIFHLGVAGLGSYALGRQLGLGRSAALGGALAFELSGIVVGLASWSPLIVAAYVWLPAALACQERILRAPAATWAVGLGGILTLQLLAGFPQVAGFTYQVLALRVVWELLVRRNWAWRRALGMTALALVLPLVLGAAQLLPAAEVMQESVRTLPITRVEQAGNWGKSWEHLLAKFADRVPAGGGPQGLLSVMSIALAGAAIGMARGRRIWAFYFLIGALFLSLAPETRLFDFYRELPVLGSLRNSFRFVWVTSFSISVLVGFGLEALAADQGERGGRPRLALAGALLAVVALHVAVPFGLAWWEWGLAGGALAAAVSRPRIGFASTVCLLMLLVVCHFVQDWRPTLGFLADEAPLYESAPAFERVGELRTPQDRVCPLLEPADLESDLAMRAKTPSLHGLPSIVDYEHLTSRRYAELYVRMTRERPLRTAGEWIRGRRVVPENRPLFDLLAARWVVTRGTDPLLYPPLPTVWAEGDLRVLENTQALPRAFYVPRAVVEENPKVRIETLADLDHDPRRVALLDAPPADGFLGRVGGRGEATIERTRSEELEVHVEATQEGFLFLSDQYYPGWTAVVNDRPTRILRANHAFRLVRVPAGNSTVVFRYRPTSVRLGAAVSLLGIAGVAGWALLCTRKGR
jgi:hypothetical protein